MRLLPENPITPGPDAFLPAQGDVMVCVTRQKTCQRLIKFGAKIAGERGAGLYVVHVAKANTNFLGSSNEAEALETLFQTANDYGADMTVLKSEDVPDTLAKFAQTHQVGHMVMGAPPKGADNALVRTVELRLPSVQFHIMEG